MVSRRTALIYQSMMTDRALFVAKGLQGQSLLFPSPPSSRPPLPEGIFPSGIYMIGNVMDKKGG